MTSAPALAADQHSQRIGRAWHAAPLHACSMPAGASTCQTGSCRVHYSRAAALLQLAISVLPASKEAAPKPEQNAARAAAVKGPNWAWSRMMTQGPT